MADERTLRLFPTPVILGRLDEADIMNAELEAAIRGQMAADNGVAKSNIGGWHSKTNLFEWAGEPAQRLVQAVIELANAHISGPQGVPVAPRWRVAAWANVSLPGHSNMIHTHGAAFWSAVYYVRAGDGERGRLLLHDPRMPALRMHAPMLQFKDFGPEGMARIKPVEGQIVLFPSWLSHSVEPWDGDGERISIALNLTAPLPPPGAKQPQITKKSGKK